MYNIGAWGVAKVQCSSRPCHAPCRRVDPCPRFGDGADLRPRRGAGDPLDRLRIERPPVLEQTITGTRDRLYLDRGVVERY